MKRFTDFLAKSLIVIIVIVTSIWLMNRTPTKENLANDDKNQITKNQKEKGPEYQKEKDCVAAYSLARDIAELSRDTTRLRELTDAQNKLYLKYPSGYFAADHVDTAKFLHKQRLNERGAIYLSQELKKCGWDEQ